MLVMSDPATASQPSLIASLFTESSTLFRRFYLALARRDCRVNNQVSLSKVGDEYGRLGVWGGDSGAQRSGRGSLDDALRYESTLRSIVVDILEDLMNDLSRGTYVDLLSTMLSIGELMMFSGFDRREQLSGRRDSL